MEAQVAGKLGLKDASAKALAAAGSFKFDETNQRLFDDILMQRRQVCVCTSVCVRMRACVCLMLCRQLNEASKSLNSARSKASKTKEVAPVLQAQTLKRLMSHQTWLKQVRVCTIAGARTLPPG